MIVVPPLTITTALLVSSNAVDAAAWAVGTTYAANAVVSRNGRNWISLQAGNVGKTPETEILWWADNGPSNQMACFDAAPSTATTKTGADLSFTVKCGRITALGFMGLVGNSITITIRDGLGGTVVYTETRDIASSEGTYYGWCFEPFNQVREVSFYGFPGTTNGYLTVDVAGASTAVGLCVMGKQFEVGQAEYGFGMPVEDRGRHYLDVLDNPVSVERGFSKGMSGTIVVERANFNRLMAFLSDYIGTPCLWIAAPGRGDLVSATAFGRFVRAVPVIANSQVITASLEIAGYR